MSYGKREKLYGERLVDLLPRVKTHCIVCKKALYPLGKTEEQKQQALLKNYLELGNFCEGCSRIAGTRARKKLRDPNYLNDTIKLDEYFQ